MITGLSTSVRNVLLQSAVAAKQALGVIFLVSLIKEVLLIDGQY